MPRPRSIRKSSGIFRDWRATNHNAAILDDVQTLQDRHDRAIEELRRKALLNATTGRIKRYVIETLAGDYLVCREAKSDGTADPDKPQVSVAKPKPLRTSTWSGQTLNGWPYASASGHQDNRSATLTAATSAYSNGATITEETLPRYTAGDNDIYAARLPTGVTDCDWLDLNASARRWIAVKTEVKVCVLVDGVQTARKMIVLGGPVYS